VRGDLIRILGGLMKRKERFDAILIETTGLADPAPVAQTFFVDDEVRQRAKLDAIVTVADAKHLLRRLEDTHEAEEQIAFADVILLNKTDLVTPDELKIVEAKIRSINAYAKLHHTKKCDIGLDQVMARGAFDLDRILDIEPEFLGEDHHEHDDDIQSFSFKTMQPLNHERFMRWMGDLVAWKGPDILRSKGILAFKDEPRRFVFQGVHMLLDGDLQRPWKPDETRESRLVFIGRNLDRGELQAGFERCVA